MFCLSKLCCLCLRSNNIHLEVLTEFSTSQIDMIKILFGESLLSELGHVLSVCKDCKQRVKEMHSFWQIGINNYEILMKYLRQLRLLGNDYGHIQIQINDFMYSSDPDILIYKDKICASKNIYTAENITADEGLKIKNEDDQECTQELSGNEDDNTTDENSDEENYQYEIQTNIENEKEFKIEKHDDFEEMYCHIKREINEMKEEEDPAPEKEEPMPEFLEVLVCETREEEEVEEFPQKLIEEIEEPISDNSNPLKCKICGKLFASKCNLIQHMLLHTGEKPHKCEACGKSFARKCSLTIHMLAHTGEKPHTCKTCGKSFAYRKSLTVHMTVHTGEKPHTCETCGKSFAYRKSLAVHMIVHTGEKPHTCGICGRSFSQKSNLTSHVTTHSSGKPYKCEICRKSFFTKPSLKRHNLLHMN